MRETAPSGAIQHDKNIPIVESLRELMNTLGPPPPTMSMIMNRRTKDRICKELGIPGQVEDLSWLRCGVATFPVFVTDYMQAPSAAIRPMRSRTKYATRAGWKQSRNHWRSRRRAAVREAQDSILMLPQAAASMAKHMFEAEETMVRRLFSCPPLR